MSARRAFTIAETLVVTVILGVMLAAIAGAIAPLFAAPDRAQAKGESLGPAAGDLYVLERDLREGDASATFACSGQPPVCGDGDLNISVTALAMPTALDSGSLDARFGTSYGGAPSWTGFIIYSQGAPAQLDRTYVADPAVAAAMSTWPRDRAQLQMLAGKDALAARSLVAGLTMRGVSSLSAAVDAVDGITDLHVVSLGTAGGRSNTTTFDDSVFSRN